MKVNRNELLNITEKVMLGTSDNAYIDGVDNLVFTEDSVHSYNDSISVSVLTGFGLSGCVNAKDFNKLLQKLSTEEIEVEVAEDLWNVESGRTKAKLKLKQDSITDYISELNLQELDWKELPVDFMSAVNLCKIASNSSSKRGVFVSGSDLITTDQIRINLYKLSAEMEQFWIDDVGVFGLAKLNEPIEKYALTENWVHFISKNNTIFTIKRNNDELYPKDKIIEWTGNLAKSDDDEENQLPKSITQTLDRVGVLSKDIDGFQAVKLQLQQKSLTVSSETDSGIIEESLDWDTPFKNELDISFMIDFTFLKEAVTKSQCFYIKNQSDNCFVVFQNDKHNQFISTIGGA